MLGFKEYFSRYTRLRTAFREYGWDMARTLALRCSESEIEEILKGNMDPQVVYDDKLWDIREERLGRIDPNCLRI